MGPLALDTGPGASVNRSHEPSDCFKMLGQGLFEVGIGAGWAAVVCIDQCDRHRYLQFET